MTQTYSKEFADNLYDQTFQIWANPEIARRQKLGSLPEEFSPWAVQVLMDPDGPESIRLNEEHRECSARALIHVKRSQG